MTAITQLMESTPHSVVTVSTASVLSLVLGALALRRHRAHTVESATVPGAGTKRRRKISAGTLAAITAFVICTSVSLNTSYRFTGDPDGLNMNSAFERVLACAAYESLMAMCVLGARERLASEEDRSGGWYGTAVWVFAGLSSIPAWVEGDGLTPATLVRIIIGSFGAALAAHSALGLELRHREGDESQTATAQIVRDLRERLMAALGLAHRARSAQEIAQERAMDRAVDLADAYHRLPEKKRSQRRGARIAKRLARAQDRAGLATDQGQVELYRARVAQRQYATQLALTEAESPWHKGAVLAEYGRTVETLEWHAEQVESLADETEAAVMAHIGTLASAPLGTPLPHPRAEDADGADGKPSDCIEIHDEAQLVAPSKAAAAHVGTSTITARVPHQSAEAHAPGTQEPQPLGDLTDYPTKRAALEALYAHRVRADDDRAVNAITADLVAELAKAGIKLDRGPAWRYVKALREESASADEAAADSVLTSA